MIYEGYRDYRGRTGQALVSLYLPAHGSTNPDVFKPKTFSIPRGIIPQNFSSLGFAVSEDLGNIQTHRLTHSLTDLCFDSELESFEIFHPPYGLQSPTHIPEF